jgi:hypothetical protein
MCRKYRNCGSAISFVNLADVKFLQCFQKFNVKHFGSAESCHELRNLGAV